MKIKVRIYENASESEEIMTTTQEAREFFENDLFATQQAGIVIEEAGENRAVCTMEITENHMNAAGIVMGGAIYTLADFTFAVASNFNKPLTVTLSSNINFLKSPKGKILKSCASVVNETSRTLVMNIDIEDELGNKVAAVTCTGFRKQ